MQSKIKISQKEIDDIYEIEGITEETQASPKEITAESEIPIEDTTPKSMIEFTEEELAADEELTQKLNWNEEDDA